MSTIQADIEARLSEVEPEVEVLLAEIVGGDLVRLFIDHPQGVTLDLCERVTHHLPEVREQYALEVSSPGIERPLRRPEHFRNAVGRTVTLRTPERKRLKGEIVSAGESSVVVQSGNDNVEIPYDAIVRGNLVYTESDKGA